MKTTRTALLKELTTKTEAVKKQAQHLLSLSTEKLKQRPAPEKWNALECIEHLNLYGDFYLPEIEQRMLKAPVSKEATAFNSGWLGNKFALSVKPAEEGRKLNTMRTFKNKNTLHQDVSVNNIKRFIKQQNTMLQLLQKAEAIHLSKVKTSISLSTFLKIRLGDTFRVVIYHNQRHLQQALKAAGAY